MQQLSVVFFVVLLHAIVEFSVYWKSLDLCDDLACRTVLAGSMVSMLAGSIDIAVLMSGYGPLVLLGGVILFFSAISRRPHHGDKRLDKIP